MDANEFMCLTNEISCSRNERIHASKLLIIALLGFTWLFNTSGLSAEAIIVMPPGKLAQNSFPMIRGDVRWQQVYDDSFFDDTSLEIASISFMADSRSRISYGSDFVVRMSTTTREPG